MDRREKLQSALDILKTERAQIAQSWYLQNCWVTQSKPGGTARSNRKYWQARSRQPIFNGKTVKHLKVEEVEDYKAAIARGRQLRQLDRQIEKLQQQLAKLISPTDLSSSASASSSNALRSTSKRSQRSKAPSSILEKSNNLADQERLVKEVLANSRALRASLQQAIARGRKLGAKNIDLRRGNPDLQ